MHVIKAKRRVERTNQGEALSRATGRMHAQKLIDLIDQTAPEDSVVDLHPLETSFADGTQRMPLPVEDAAVVAIVEGSADTTRRMSAVDLDAAVAAVEAEVHSESTMRMSAIQANQLAALITPVEVSVFEEAVTRVHDQPSEPPPVAQEVVVTFAPRALPLPAPAPEEMPALAEAIEVADAPRRRGMNPWMIGALIALAGAVTGLVAAITV